MERIDALTAGAPPSAVAAAKALLEEYRDYTQAIAGPGFRQVKLEREIAELPQSYAGADTEKVAAAELPGALVLRRRQRGGVASAQHEGQGGSGESPEALPTPRYPHAEQRRLLGAGVEARGVQNAPQSRLLLIATVDDRPAGCIAYHALPEVASESACELKRLYVRDAFRQSGLGARLVDALIEQAKSAGYAAIYLDTEPDAMASAYRLYLRLGFADCPPYRAADAGVRFMRRGLAA